MASVKYINDDALNSVTFTGFDRRDTHTDSHMAALINDMCNKVVIEQP